MKILPALLILLMLVAGCSTPSGFRLRGVNVYIEGSHDPAYRMAPRVYGYLAGINLHFEVTYPDDWVLDEVEE